MRRYLGAALTVLLYVVGLVLIGTQGLYRWIPHLLLFVPIAAWLWRWALGQQANGEDRQAIPRLTLFFGLVLVVALFGGGLYPGIYPPGTHFAVRWLSAITAPGWIAAAALIPLFLTVHALVSRVIARRDMGMDWRDRRYWEEPFASAIGVMNALGGWWLVRTHGAGFATTVVGWYAALLGRTPWPVPPVVFLGIGLLGLWSAVLHWASRYASRRDHVGTGVRVLTITFPLLLFAAPLHNRLFGVTPTDLPLAAVWALAPLHRHFWGLCLLATATVYLWQTVFRFTQRWIESQEAAVMAQIVQLDPTNSSGPAGMVTDQQRPDRDRERDSASRELDQLVGLSSVKAAVRGLLAHLKVTRERWRRGLPAEPQPLHLAFEGSAGTGKKTVAFLLGRLLFGSGVLPHGRMLVVEAALLLGETKEETVRRVQGWVEEARGGVLYLEDAAALAGGSSLPRDAVAALNEAMDGLGVHLLVVFSGSPHDLRRLWITHPVLRARVRHDISFPDLAPNELLDVVVQMATAHGYRLSRDARSQVCGHLSAVREQKGFANAHTARKLLDAAILQQAVRCDQAGPERLTNEELTTLLLPDFAGHQGR